MKHDRILAFEGITDGFGKLPALVALWMENGALSDYLTKEFSKLSDRRKLDLVSVSLSTETVNLAPILDSSGGRWPWLSCVSLLIDGDIHT